MEDPRIAIVQHGDYVEARDIVHKGLSEPYFAMYHSIEVLEKLVSGRPHLIISLTAPQYDVDEGSGRYIGLPAPSFLSFPGLGNVQALLWASMIKRLLKSFQPTHLFLRTGDILAWQILKLARKNNWNTLVLFACILQYSGFRDRFINKKLIKLLNLPFVHKVGNHKQPATQSWLEAGLDARKSIAWDWPGARHPSDFPIKTLRQNPEPLIAYVGTISKAKGVADLVDAVIALQNSGEKFRLVLAGDGPDFAALKQHALNQKVGNIEFKGRIGNDEAFDLMMKSSVVCVPSRHCFTEGMPMSLTEALASRTPIVASDHPVLTRAFAEGEGLRFFTASSPQSLAAVLKQTLNDEHEYERLSQTTADAFARVECKVTFRDFVEEWSASWH